MKECIVESIINNQDNLNDIINDIRFYYNLARMKGEPIIVELWSFPRKESDSISTLQKVG